MAAIAARRPRLDALPEALAVATVALVALALAGGVLVGGVMAFVAIAGAVTAIAAIIQPRIGLYAATIIVLCVVPLTANPAFGPDISLVNDPVQGTGLLAHEIMIGAAALGVLRIQVFERGAELRMGDMLWPILLLATVTTLAFGYGIMRGGDFRMAVWETRAIYLLIPIYLVMTNTVRTRGDLAAFAHVAAAAAFVMSAEAVYRHLVYIRPGYQLDVILDLAFSHEASIVAGLLAMYFIARTLWSASLTGSVGYALLALIPLAALMVMKRRAGIVALDAALIMFAIALFRNDAFRFVLIVPVTALFFAALLMATWNNPGGSGQFSRSFQAITQTSPTQDQDEDQASDDYRARETANIRANINARPVQGLGFGQRYDMPQQLPDLSSFWPFFHYVPHNSVLWMWMKAGILGFVATMMLFGAGVLRSGQLFRRFNNDPLQPATIVGGAGVLMFAVFAYVDLGLASQSAMVFFGLCLGLLGVLAEFAKLEPTAPGGNEAGQ